MFLKNLFNRKELNSDIEESFKEIQRQLSQGGGYPFSKARLRGALQNIIQGNFTGSTKVEVGFEHIFTTEPLTIIEFKFDKFQETDKQERGYSSFQNGFFSEKHWETSNPLEVGSKKQFTLYKIKIDSLDYFDDCIRFVKYMGGNFTNLHGLMTAYQLIGDMFPKTFFKKDVGDIGCRIWGLDNKKNCYFSKGGFLSGPGFDVTALSFDKQTNRFEFGMYPMEKTWTSPLQSGNEYLLFYYDV